jgi:hypothetical protein
MALADLHLKLSLEEAIKGKMSSETTETLKRIGNI